MTISVMGADMAHAAFVMVEIWKPKLSVIELKFMFPCC
jgi:hypothetical protein